MATSAGTLQEMRGAGAPRWRAFVVASALAGTLCGMGFTLGRATAPDADVIVRRPTVGSLPAFVRPGNDRGQAKYGPGSAEPTVQPIRPGTHAGDRVKG
jgi:hypothetical protein